LTPPFLRLARRAFLAACVAAGTCVTVPVAAQEESAADLGAVPERPVPLPNRWQENWSVLADDRVTREPGDEFKYIPLSGTDPLEYLSLGANVRERYEDFDAAQFGIGPNRGDRYVLSRLEVQGDLHLGAHVEVFAQLQSDFAFGKDLLTPVDQDRLGLEQGFIAITEPVAGGSLTVRVGRQEIAFDLQRFVSIRDGPNVHQSYDAAWAEFDRDDWRLIALWSHPVLNRDNSPFDDYSSPHLSHGGLKLERQISPAMTVSATWSRFIQDDAVWPKARGTESRDILDGHWAGAVSRFDWDVEGMSQRGHVGDQEIRAWALGSLGGYTLEEVPWAPRLGFQFDAASGDASSHSFGTFNPLFPNGYYFSLSALTGYVNLVHAKASLSVQPTARWRAMLAFASQWRQTVADAIYTAPALPLTGTEGRGSAYTGKYGQLHVEIVLSRNASLSVEALRFVVGEAIRAAGGHDSDYLGLEIKYAW
jgi:hypothetical protein